MSLPSENMARSVIIRIIRALPALAAVAAWGCSGLFSDDPPARTSTEISSSATDSVIVVTSTAFFPTNNGGVTLVEADTTTVTLPYVEETDITETRRYLIRVFPSDSAAIDTAPTPTFMRVRVDGDVRFEGERDLSAMPMEFRFIFAGTG